MAIAVEREAFRLNDFARRQDRFDFAELEGIVAAYEVSPQCLVVQTTEGREVRITARYDLLADAYITDYERRMSLPHNGSTHHVWAQTPAYEICTADDLESCLQAALIEVNRVHLY